MIQGTTATGFSFSINEANLDDWRLQEALADLSSEDPEDTIRGNIAFAKLLLGNENYKKLKKHIAKQNGGRIPNDAMSAELIEIMKSSQELKK